MKWSKYTLLFESDRHGRLLYSALTNTFARVDERTAVEIERIRRDPQGYDFTGNPGLYLQLVTAKALVEPGEEEDLIRVLRMQRLYENFDATTASVTIVPTLACNFNCTYCYEKFRRPVHMDERVEAGLIAFLERFRGLKHLGIEWFGGEPTLRFDTIRRVSARIEQLGIPWSASLVTNGYLLGMEAIAQLAGLRIGQIQVTIDGTPEVHDARRPLAGGGPTYHRIIRNLDELLARWEGELLLRVNVDRTNRDEFFEIRAQLLERFRGKRVSIAPGIVVDEAPHLSCSFDRDDACRFRVEAYRKHGITDQSFYPELRNGCVATRKNGYVVGPTGEIYKCYVDIGIAERVVGSIFEGEPWNLGLLAKYMVGADLFEDPACRECFFLPLCDGGCANARLKSGRLQEHVLTCVEYKEMLPEWLEIHYEIRKQTAMPAPGDRAWSDHP